VTSLLGEERFPKNNYGTTKLFSLFYKLVLASELAISQQTEEAVCLMKRLPSNGDA